MSAGWKNGSTTRWRKIRERILIRDNNQCQLCGKTEGQMHIDHIIPKRLGGQDNDENLRVLCQRCNLSKGGSFFDKQAHPRLFHGLNIPKNASVSHE